MHNPLDAAGSLSRRDERRHREIDIRSSSNNLMRCGVQCTKPSFGESSLQQQADRVHANH